MFSWYFWLLELWNQYIPENHWSSNFHFPWEKDLSGPHFSGDQAQLLSRASKHHHPGSTIHARDKHSLLLPSPWWAQPCFYLGKSCCLEGDRLWCWLAEKGNLPATPDGPEHQSLLWFFTAQQQPSWLISKISWEHSIVVRDSVSSVSGFRLVSGYWQVNLYGWII